jgi:allophanate hydrolase subunit 2
VSDRFVRVRRPGALTTVQDAGRPGLAHVGVPRSGALDATAFHLANRLVGNDENLAVLETTVDGVGLAFEISAVVAVTGALAPIDIDRRAAGWSVPVFVQAGQTLNVGRAQLGSASTDLLSGLGPAPLSAGDVLPIGPATTNQPAIDVAPYPLPSDHFELAAHLGPHEDWLTDEGLAAFTAGAWQVSPDSNRIALRLNGPALRRSRDGELPSEGLVTGAIELLPDGQLVIFLADHPTTGGYPVIAVADPSGLAACAQAWPGARLTFRCLAGPARDLPG